MVQKKDPFKLSFRWAFLLFCSLIAVRGFYYSFSDGFSLERISHTIPKEGNELPPPTPEELTELKKICSQEFHYLAKGSQAYAFCSADRQYVLKLFKYYHLKPIPWLEHLPLPPIVDTFVQGHLERRKKKAELTQKSYRICHDLIPRECGMLFLQIIPSDNYRLDVTCHDRLGRIYTIDLARHGFIIQKRADLIFPSLSSWLKEGKIDKAKRFLHSLISLLEMRTSKGIQDQDPDLHKNAGVIGEQAIFIDVGSFHKNEKVKCSQGIVQDITKTTRHLREWLQKEAPELEKTLDDEILALCPRLDNEKIGVISQNTK
jgi:hypothetical protein